MKRSRQDSLSRLLARVAGEARKRALTSTFDGSTSCKSMAYMRMCTHQLASIRSNIIFTRDTGHHTSGWMRNPDYERCEHLSISPIPGRIIVPGRQLAELSVKLQRRICDAFFGWNVRLLWAESPKSDVGKRAGVWHWRLFCDEHWQPIKPRGEVYSSDFTEVGFKSATEIFELGGPEVVSSLDPT